MPLHASPAGLLGRFAPSNFALAVSVALLLEALCFALAFSVASLARASCLALAFSDALLPGALRSHLACFARALKLRSAKKKKTCLYPFDPLRAARAAKRNLTYPMSLPGSEGVSMTSFMRIRQNFGR